LEREPLVDFRIESGSGPRIGYLYLNRFDPGAKAQLDKAFAEFNRVKIEELVIDLRYNPGGAVFVVDHLAGLIAGNQHAGEVLYRISNNTKYADANYAGRFEFNPDRLDVTRVFVLTSEHTCSASELLVVSLQAYMPVITIGEVTCGKPFGSRRVRFGNQTFRVLSFRVGNARGNGFYNDGLVPQCFKADDLKQNFKLGTGSDPMFKIAQTYMKNGTCE
jgi:C-terminal processing protease CtpA/Prc